MFYNNAFLVHSVLTSGISAIISERAVGFKHFHVLIKLTLFSMLSLEKPPLHVGVKVAFIITAPVLRGLSSSRLGSTSILKLCILISRTNC